MKTIAIISGPNLNMLGTRQVAIYGAQTLDDIQQQLTHLASELSVSLQFFQSNHEGALVDFIQSCQNVDGIIINPAAYTHTSIAIRDALLSIAVPTVEVHLSNVYQREPFRHHSTISDVVIARVMGFGAASYELGLRGLVRAIMSQRDDI